MNCSVNGFPCLIYDTLLYKTTEIIEVHSAAETHHFLLMSILSKSWWGFVL